MAAMAGLHAGDGNVTAPIQSAPPDASHALSTEAFQYRARVNDDTTGVAPTQLGRVYQAGREAFDGHNIKAAVGNAMVNDLRNPLAVAEMVGTSALAGAALKTILPEGGPVELIAGAGVAAYFGYQSLKPMLHAVDEARDAKTMTDIHKSANDMDDTAGSFIVNFGLCKKGYKFGENAAGHVLNLPALGGLTEAKGNFWNGVDGHLGGLITDVNSHIPGWLSDVKSHLGGFLTGVDHLGGLLNSLKGHDSVATPGAFQSSSMAMSGDGVSAEAQKHIENSITAHMANSVNTAGGGDLTNAANNEKEPEKQSRTAAVSDVMSVDAKTLYDAAQTGSGMEVQKAFHSIPMDQWKSAAAEAGRQEQKDYINNPGDVPVASVAFFKEPHTHIFDISANYALRPDLFQSAIFAEHVNSKTGQDIQVPYVQDKVGSKQAN